MFRELFCFVFLLPAATSYSFVTFGDYGTGTALQREGAAILARFCEATPDACSRIITLADNFYNGPETVTDPRWWTEFSAMYPAESIPGPFSVIAGNHDYAGSIAAMLSFKNDSRWDARGLNYTLVVPEADLTFFFIDTSRGCPSYMKSPYGDCNDKCAKQLAALADCTPTTAITCWTAHLAWLDSALAAATTTWKVVAGHHPVSSENVKMLTAVLEARGVQAALFGHVHDLQHAVSIPSGGASAVNHFISGAGAFINTTSTHGQLPVVARSAGTARYTTRALADTCAHGACAGAVIEQRFGPANGPGFLAVDVDNSASTPLMHATFYTAAGAIYSVAFDASGRNVTAPL